jgi:hypothetical protein
MAYPPRIVEPTRSLVWPAVTILASVLVGGLAGLEAAAAQDLGVSAVCERTSVNGTSVPCSAARREPVESSPRLFAASNSSAVVTVSNVANLSQALKGSAAGATIELAPGTYVGVSIVNMKFDQPVTITSADPAHRALLIGLKVANSSGLVLKGLELSTVGDPDAYYPFRIQSSENVKFLNLDFHGDQSAPPSTGRRGVLAANNTDIRFEGCHFHHMWGGLTANNNLRVDIIGNTFSDLNKGAVEMGGSSLVNISNNLFTNFRLDRGTHPDAIQLYTAGTQKIAHDILIKDNLYYRGTGDAVQGIFIQDEVGTLPYNDLTVSGNAIIGGMWNSIYIKHATGNLRVTNNIAASWAGLDMPGVGTVAAAKTQPTITKFLAFLFLRGDLSKASVTLSGNKAQIYMDPAGRRIQAPRGNIELGDIGDQGSELLAGWVAIHPAIRGMEREMVDTAQRPI